MLVVALVASQLELPYQVFAFYVSCCNFSNPISAGLFCPGQVCKKVLLQQKLGPK